MGVGVVNRWRRRRHSFRRLVDSRRRVQHEDGAEKRSLRFERILFAENNRLSKDWPNGQLGLVEGHA